MIGSGIGGLTVAALLSKIHQKRVLVLEQHFVPGGLTHEFQRHGYHFDVGLHYVGEMEKGQAGRKLFDFITDGTLEWTQMPPVFEKFIYPDHSFDVPSDPQEYLRTLQEKFPHEKAALKKYFSDCRKAALWYSMEGLVEVFPPLLRHFLKLTAWLMGGISRQTTENYMDQRFKNNRLKSLLVSQWGDYGLPPSQSLFGLHAVIVRHYWKGGWYPVGGAGEIFKKIFPVIKAAGGAVEINRRVEEILVEDGKAVGVRVRNTKIPGGEPVEIRAPVVVSDAGSYITYTRLLKSAPVPFREELEKFPVGLSAVTLYLGLKESPVQLGFRGENYWVYDSENHESANRDPLHSGSYYLSFPSLKDPKAAAHTAEMILFCEYDFFKRWSGQAWKKRDEAYYELKEEITQYLLGLLEKRFPGFTGLIAYQELSTPLTVEFFEQTNAGQFYGIPAVPQRVGKEWARVKTPVQNLYLTGSDVLSHGILGALMGGVKTVGMMSGPFGFFKVMAKIMGGNLKK